MRASLKTGICGLAFFAAMKICAGQFGEAGTQWQHCFLFDGEIPATFNSMTVTSLDAYTLDSLVCHTLFIDDIYSFTSRDTMTVCNIGDRTYYMESGMPVLLYDFSLGVGDTLTIRMPSTLFTEFYPEQYPAEYAMALVPQKVVIESVEMINYSGVDLIRQHFRHVGEYQYLSTGKYVTERLGFAFWIFPYISIDYAEINPYSDVQTYDDAEIAFSDTASACLISALQDTKSQAVLLYPNPASSVIHLPGITTESIVISDNVGRPVVQALSFNGESLDISTLSPGLYYIQITGTDNQMTVSRFVKI